MAQGSPLASPLCDVTGALTAAGLLCIWNSRMGVQRHTRGPWKEAMDSIGRNKITEAVRLTDESSG
jgi:hypothetical protein